jgi:Flp pilus assembly protein TadD
LKVYFERSMSSCYNRINRIADQGMRRLACLLLFFCTLYASPPAIERAESLYQRTDYDASLRVLDTYSAPDAAAFVLTGKNYFMLGNYAKAAQLFEKAVAIAPNVSDYHLWLGRAYGRRAETGGMLLAPSRASKARQALETAVALDPQNGEAMNDLFEYYLNAPGVLGGGSEKAEALARRIEHERPAEYHHELSQLADHKKQYSEALAHLHKAMELAPHELGRVIDLARYLAKLGRMEESDTYFAQASKRWPGSPGIAFAQAETYVHHHRELDRSRLLLEQYLKAQVTPDDPPKQEAEKLLQQIASR